MTDETTQADAELNAFLRNHSPESILFDLIRSLNKVVVALDLLDQRLTALEKHVQKDPQANESKQQ